MFLKKFQIFYGWYILAALFLIWTIVYGLILSSFTAYIEPLTSMFGWSFAQVSFAFSLRSLIYVIFMPITGLIIDRWSAKKLVFTGITLASIGILLLSWINTLGQFYLCYILIGIGGSACIATIPLTLLGRWFRKKLSLATGILLSASGVGGFLVPLVTRSIDVLGWHTAMLAMGLSVLVIISPLALFIRQSPEQYGYLPDGEVHNDMVHNKEEYPAQENGVDSGVKQALKSRAFWHISLAFMCHLLVVHSVTTQIMPFLSTIGSDRMTSSFVATALAIVSVFGRLCFGWFGDKLNKKWTAASGTILVGLSLLLFSYLTTTDTWVLIPAVILFGIGWGGITLHSVLLKDYFGTSNLGAVIGFSVSVTSIGMMIGPLLVSWLFEGFGNYRIAWLIIIGAAIIGVISQLTNPAVSTGRQSISSSTDSL